MKTIRIREESLKRLREETKDIPPYEADEFIIGSEGGGPSTYYHVDTSGEKQDLGEGWARDHYNIDTDKLYMLEITPDDEKPDYWDDEEDGEWIKEDEATYYIIGYDASENKLFGKEFYYDDLEDVFGEELAEMIINHEGRKSGDDFYIDEIPYIINHVDNTNPESVWSFLKSISDNRGPSGFILPDGDCVYSYDHRGMAGQADLSLPELLNMGAIRFTCTYGIDLSVDPTSAQICVLKNLLRYAEDTIYLDIVDTEGDVICSGSYEPERYQRAIYDIVNYFENGAEPMMEEKQRVNENIIDEVEPEEVDLRSFKKKPSLNPEIWKGGLLNPKIRLKLLDIADDFWDSVEVSWVKPVDYVLMGSMCNYNWSEFSDIDLHILVDFSEVDKRTDFVKQYFDSKKNDWNNSHKDLNMFGYQIEFYIQDINEENASGGIYSLEKNQWIKKPEYNDLPSIGPEKYAIKDKAADIMTIIDGMCDAYEVSESLYDMEKLNSDAEALNDKIRDMRKKGLDREGEMGVGNIVFKVLRRTGYLEKLKNLRRKTYDDMNSITEAIISYLHKSLIKEEVVADGNSTHNPYQKKWKQERKELKEYIIAYGTLMTSMENGKQYAVLFQPEISRLVGNNYGLCVQYNPDENKYLSTIYIRAMDKFTSQIFQAQFDTRGMDNMGGTADDNLNVPT